MSAVNVCSTCAKEYTAAEWEALPLVGPAERDTEDLEVRVCNACGSHIALEVAKVFRKSRPRITTIPSPPPAPGARRDSAVLALHLARTRVDELATYYGTRVNVGPNARLAMQIMACFSPVLTAIEHLIPEAPAA